jgi:acyl carrier protein
VVGELCIGGVGLARGYVGCPAMTAQCFLPDPFRTGERLYRTGDRVRLRVDGNIEFIGRWDEQLKISGYRVEIGEIESVLRQQPYVRQAVVVPDPATDGTARLRAFVVADISRLAADPDCAAIAGIELPAHDPSILPRPWQERLGVFLKSRLRVLLPAVMVPTTICVADELPLTSAGKVDRDALLARFVPLAAQVGYDAPVSQVQKALADIWSGLLQLERIGLNDDFFELGGHSLMAMRVVSRVEEELRIALPVRVLFEKSRLRDLSAHVESSLHGLQLAGNILPPGILKKLAGLTAQEAAELMQLLQTNG